MNGYKIWHTASGKWKLFKVEGNKNDVLLAEYTNETDAIAGMQRCINKVISFYDEHGKKVT